MATIDVGAGAIFRGDTNLSMASARTIIDLNNAANDTGTLDTFEVYFKDNAVSVKMGTFSGSGTSYDDRDYESIGNVTGGSKQTFTGKNCDVSSGDFLGVGYGSASGDGVLKNSSGYNGVAHILGDKFNSGSNTYSILSGDAISIYATGTTAGGSTPAIKVGGVWKETSSQKIKVGGVWKAISNIKVKVSGVWKSAT